MKPEHFQLVRRREVRIAGRAGVRRRAASFAYWAVPRMNAGVVLPPRQRPGAGRALVEPAS